MNQAINHGQFALTGTLSATAIMLTSVLTPVVAYAETGRLLDENTINVLIAAAMPSGFGAMKTGNDNTFVLTLDESRLSQKDIDAGGLSFNDLTFGLSADELVANDFYRMTKSGTNVSQIWGKTITIDHVMIALNAAVTQLGVDWSTSRISSVAKDIMSAVTKVELKIGAGGSLLWATQQGDDIYVNDLKESRDATPFIAKKISANTLGLVDVKNREVIVMTISKTGKVKQVAIQTNDQRDKIAYVSATAALHRNGLFVTSILTAKTVTISTDIDIDGLPRVPVLTDGFGHEIQVDGKTHQITLASTTPPSIDGIGAITPAHMVSSDISAASLATAAE